jgi:hypothetical protein
VAEKHRGLQNLQNKLALKARLTSVTDIYLKRYTFMEYSTTKSRIISHIIAVLFTASLCAALALTFYCAWVIPGAVSAADLGGPLNFVIIPIMGGLVGVAISVFTFLPLGLLAERFNYRRWFQVVASLCGVLALVVIAGWFSVEDLKAESRLSGSHLIVGSMCLCYVGSFLAYLSCLGVCRRLFP